MSLNRTRPPRRPARGGGRTLRRVVACSSALLLGIGLVPAALLTQSANAVQAPVGQGFSVTPSDLKFILAQIKIAEHHVANTTEATGLCGALVGTGPNQIPSPLISKGLRTVDGSCNNLQPGQGNFGAADQTFPRLGSKAFRPAEGRPAGLFAPTAGPLTSYAQKKGSVYDTQPRVISNLIVDQTSTNPAAVAAAGAPVRTQGNTGVEPCTAPGVPVDCVPAHETLFIPNVTTDVGLSPPYNSLFTIFGQFFDHGVDQTVKGGASVFVPLQKDDPLIAGPNHIFEDNPATPAIELGADDLDPSLRFMALTRGQNQPGPDLVLGDVLPTTNPPTPCTARNTPAGCDESIDDVQDATNTDSPWVDQSQTYTSHPSHQAFLREYKVVGGSPVATGMLLSGKPRVSAAQATPTNPATDGGISTWKSVKDQAATKLGFLLTDADVTNIPMVLADPYGNLILNGAGMPQYVTETGLVSGNIGSPVPVPANVKHFDTPFLTDIAHSAAPTAVGPDTDTVAGKSLDTTDPAGSYDDELLDAHFACGDGRCNENIALSAVHQIFHSEHDRLIGDIQRTLNANPTLLTAYEATSTASAPDRTFSYGERLFQAARFVTEMEYQHLVFEEFARKVQPAINPFEPFAFTQTEINPAVKAEFAHAVYRFGHSMLTETISRTNEDGSSNDISLLEGFLNPPTFTDGGSAGELSFEDAAGSIVMGMSDQVGNELDEFVTDTLRNNLLGLPLDLSAINMTRARSEGIPALNVLRRELFGSTNDGQLKPYTSWVDFGEHLKHPASLVNFVAAYGKHLSIASATTLADKREAARLIVAPTALEVTAGTPPADAAAFMNSTNATPANPETNWANVGNQSKTGLDSVDLWVGGLAETTNAFGGLLGSTFNYVFENQLTDLQNGDRLYYLARTPGMNLRTQLEGNSFAELMMRNTNAKALKADSFATADCKFDLKNLAGTKAAFDAPGGGNTVPNDPNSECNETALLIRQPDGTIQYRNRNAVDPSGINGQSVYNGTPGVDRVFGGVDSDTFWGGLGNDIIEGGDGADVALGGEGDDIITDLAGDDVPKGGPGDDAIDAGPGLDIVMGGEGKDFTNGGANANETFGGEGDDFIMLGQSLDAAFGDSGDDYQEGGDQPDLMQGDSGNLFFLDDSQKPGHDILIGQGGDDDYDEEGGDDIGVAGPGVEKVASSSGFDWEIGQGDPQPQDADLALPLTPLDILQVGVRDKFNETEALSGWKLDDILRGDDIVPSAAGGGGFMGCNVLDQQGLDRIAGLDALVPPLNTSLASVIAASASNDCPTLTGNPATTQVWGDGNVLLGGAGSDLIEGRGAADIIDGDRYLSVRLSVRNGAGTEIGSASIEGPGQSAMTSRYLHVGGGPTGALIAGSPTLMEDVFAGKVNPGNIVAVREVVTPSAGETTGNIDTALFSDVRANYSCTVGAVTSPCGTVSTGNNTIMTVTHTAAGGGGGGNDDGTDTLRNIEKLQFADTVAPPAPIIGLAVAGNSSATVDWTATVGETTGFDVEVTRVGTPDVVVAPLRLADTGTTTLDVTSLANGTAYKFRVRAKNDVGAGPFSAFSNTVTPITVPDVPTIGTAIAGAASATVAFTPPAATGGATITRLDVRVVNAAGAQVGALRPASPTATSLLVTNLTNGATVRFQVAAVSAAGSSAFSALSNRVTPTAAAVATVPGAPLIRNARPGAVGGPVTAIANWRVPANGGSAITGYRVTAIPATGTPIVSAVLTPVAVRDETFEMTLPAGNYRFTVVAINAVGTSAPSAQSNQVAAR
jgi:Ca2+-binding RTX toxin-like protein